MGTIRSVASKTRAVRDNLPSEIENIVERLSKEIIKLNQEDQLFKGLYNDGRKTPTYSQATEEISRGTTGKGFPKEAGKPFNHYSTGELFKSIDIVFTNNKVKFFTDKPNHPFLQKKEGLAKKLFGLTKENQQKLNYELILPMIRKWVQSTMK